MSYWEKRAAADKERAYADAAEVTQRIEQLHSAASRRALQMARRIRQRFKRAYGLTDEEAAQLLSKPVGREEYLEILDEIGRLGPKNPKRAQLMAKAAAPSYAHRISVAEAMEDELSAVCAQMAEREIKLLEKHLESTAIEQNLRAGFRLQQEAGVAWKFSGISEELAWQMIHKPWSGMEFSRRVWASWDKLPEILNTVLLEGIATGCSVYAMADDVAEAMGAPLHRARTLVRTETTKVCNDADFEAYKESGAEWYRYLATLDLRTSKICRDLDGTRHKVEDGVVGKNRPPMHPNCRSTTTADFTQEELKAMERRARDPITEKTVKVPSDMTYKEWLKLQEETYGEERMAIAQKMSDNEKRDKKQFAEYQAILGKKQMPKDLASFQLMKYTEPEGWEDLKGFVDYKRKVPGGTKAHYQANKEIESLKLNKGTVVPIVRHQAPSVADLSTRKDQSHIMKRMAERGITDDEVRGFVNDAKICVSQFGGTRLVYYSDNGVTVLTKSADYEPLQWIAKTTWGKADFDENTERIIEIGERYGTT